MDSYSKTCLLILTVLLPSLVCAQGQSCTMPSRDTIHQLLTSHISYLTNGDAVDVTLTQHAITCAALSDRRNTYMYASIAIVFQTDSSNIESCPSSTNCTGFFHIVCNDQLSSWILDEISPSTRFEFDHTAPIDMAEPRVDCGVCSHMGFFTPDFHYLYDNTTHCYSCHEDCSGTGLGYCHGATVPGDCCSYYDGDMCTDDCGEGRFANEDTNFECTDCVTQPSDCLNNGVLPDSDSCMCDCTNTGYHGITCNIDINECEEDTNICQNGGQCINTQGDYNCSCPDGFRGKNCEHEIDECQTNPCVHGQCVDGINSYTCNCDFGYTGDNCDVYIDECSDNPCHNGGKCFNVIDNTENRFICECVGSWTGDQCDQCNSDNCADAVCDEARPVCNRCNDGYSLVNNDCVLCEIRNCSRCGLHNNCELCNPGLIPNDDGTECVHEDTSVNDGRQTDDKSSGTLSIEIIVAIDMIGIAIIIAVLVVILFVLYTRRRKSNKTQEKC